MSAQAMQRDLRKSNLCFLNFLNGRVTCVVELHHPSGINLEVNGEPEWEVFNQRTRISNVIITTEGHAPDLRSGTCHFVSGPDSIFNPHSGILPYTS